MTKKGKLIESPDWSKVVMEASAKERAKIAKQVIENLKYYGTKDGEETELGRALYKELTSPGSSKKYELIGFQPSIKYTRVNPLKADDFHKGLYLHPWGGPTLLFKIKHLPIVLIISPDIRFNESLLSEAKKNGYNIMLSGFSG